MFWSKTPLIRSSVRNNVWYKLENLQPSGSFKDRGIGNMILKTCEQTNVQKLICSSGGNAGHAVATAGEKIGLPVDVFVPVTTKPMMIEKLKLRGATVHVGGANWNEADRCARQTLAETNGAVYIPPFDHPLIWDGNSTIIDELVENNIKPGAIVLSVGGGGLLRGVQLGLERHGWTDVTIVAVETHGTASYAAAYAAGEVVSLSKIDSIATSLGALAVTESTLRSSIKTIPLVVSDQDAVRGLTKFADEKLMLVEPACGASLITCYDDSYFNQIENMLGDNKEIVIITCGGSVVSLEMIASWKQQFQL